MKLDGAQSIWFLTLLATSLFCYENPCGKYIEHNVELIFTKVFFEKKFGESNSFSGKGSDYSQTEEISLHIPRVIEKYNIKTLVDLPCGDFYWMKKVDLQYLDHYIGVDIVAPLITILNNEYANKKRSFIKRDIISDPLPEGDMILIRDCFVHLKFHHIIRALFNIKKAGYKYILMTTFPNHPENIDLSHTCGWRTLDFTSPPFNFPQPLELINEKCPVERYSDKSLGLWKIDDIR